MFSTWLVPPRWIPSRKIGPPASRHPRGHRRRRGGGPRLAKRPRIRFYPAASAQARPPRIKVLMNILFFAENSPYLAIRVGGAENSMRLMAEGLAAKGHHVTFVSLRPDVLPFTRRFRAGGVEVVLLPAIRRSLPQRLLRRLGRAEGRARAGGSATPAGAGSAGRSSGRGAGRIDILYAFYEVEFLRQALVARDRQQPGMRIVMRMAGPRLAGGGAARGRGRRARRGGRALQRRRRDQLPLAEQPGAGRGAGGASSGCRSRRARASWPTSGWTWAACPSSGPGRGRSRARDRGGDALLALPEAPGPAGGGAGAASAAACPSG